MSSQLRCALGVVLAIVLILAWGCGSQGGQNNQPNNQGDTGQGDDCVTREEVAQLVDPLRDPAPGGCNGCHKDAHRLSNDLPEGHPQVSEDVGVDDCQGCHSNLGEMLHQSHLTSTTYVETLHGNCTGCHKLQEDGTIVLKGTAQEGS